MIAPNAPHGIDRWIIVVHLVPHISQCRADFSSTSFSFIPCITRRYSSLIVWMDDFEGIASLFSQAPNTRQVC
jgi:hypothetical protein